MHIRCPNCAQRFDLVNPDELDELSCPSCGSRFHLVGDLSETAEINESIPSLRHFDLLEVLGSGHFGCVWKARDNSLDRTVAVKIPHRERLNPEDAEFFFREARTGGQLNHANIVTVHEVGRDGNTVYIVSELVHGVTLGEWCKVYHPDLRKSVEICIKIATALHHAHEQGVIHRDLKPGNVLMTAQGEPKIADFGLAKRDGAEATIAVDGRILGTPAFMSPEQAAGQSHDADRRSDVYSLGVILYELICGKRPFAGGSRVLLHQVIHDAPKSPRSFKKSIPRDLETICLKMLEKSPSRRYDTAADVADDLLRFQNGEAIQARPISQLEKIARGIKRYPARAAAVFFACLVLVLIPFALFSPDDPPPEESSAIPRPEGSREVKIATDPVGGTIIYYPLDPISSIPDFDRAKRVDSSDSSAFLMPGDYLVVAYLDESTFHEVYRHVPGEGESPQAYRHRDWTINGDVVTLPGIKLFDQSQVTEGMIKVTGGTWRTNIYQAKELDLELADFYIDPTEYEDPVNSGRPMIMVNWNDAVSLAESAGRRLMSDMQYEYLATKAGTAQFPGTTTSITEDIWATDQFDAYPEDVLSWERADGMIKGLFSNSLEWTETRYPGGLNLAEVRCIRGGPSYASPDPDQTTNATPQVRLGSSVLEKNNRLSFRCVRSSYPRRDRSDFSFPRQ